MDHLRGELVPGAPVFGVLSTRPRRGESPTDLARRLAAEFLEPSSARAARVAGSGAAARVDGQIDMGEGLAEDGIERIAIVVAEAGDELVTLTVRTRPTDPVADAVDDLLASLRLAPAEDGSETAGRLSATYRLSSSSQGEASSLASWIAREQTLEVPAGVGGRELEAALLGRVDDLVPNAEGGYDATVSYAQELVGSSLLQLVNVAYGNVSLVNGVRLVDLTMPSEVLDALRGPRYGIEGLRRLVGAEAQRPLVAVAIKPVGRTSAELAELASIFARAGVDVIKDDHGIVDQEWAPFLHRVETVGAAVAAVNAETGGRTAYFPNVTGPFELLSARLHHAEAHGCPGVLICPSLMGMDIMRTVTSPPWRLAVLAHPTHGQSAPGRDEGIAPELLYGTIYRAAGADAVVYVNAEGRFAWPVEVCEAINARLRGRLGRLRPTMPVPAGGVDAGQAARWFEHYGPDTMLLIGGSLLARNDLLGATRRLVEAAAAWTRSGADASGRDA
jgi:ribulose-bisphosphate carboxylase large chain